MSTWTGAVLGATMGTLQGVLVGTGDAVMGYGNFSQGFALGQQVWMSAGDVAQNAVINYDAVSPGSIGCGDLVVMWSNSHTILVLKVSSKMFVVYEQCGEGLEDREGGPHRTTYASWQEVRNHGGRPQAYDNDDGQFKILHHARTKQTVASTDQVFNLIKPTYQNQYNMLHHNCHGFCDDMLVLMGLPAPGIQRTAAARMRRGMYP